MAGKEINFLDLIKKGASREPSKEPSQRQQTDNFAKFTAGQTSKSRTPQNDPLSLSGLNMPGQQNPHSTDPLARFAEPHRFPPKNSNIQDPRGEDNLKSKPLSRYEDDRGREHQFKKNAGFAGSISDDRHRDPLIREPASRSGSRSPLRQVDAGRERQVSARRIDSYVDYRQSNNSGYGSAPNQMSGEYEDLYRSRQSHRLNTSTYQDQNTLRNLDKFNDYYREQDRNRDSVKQSMDIFERKSREQLKKELSEIRAKKNASILVFLGTIAIVIFMFALFVTKIHSRKPFCDTGMSQSEECRPCPEFGACQDGKLISCSYGHKLKGEHCISQVTNERLVYIMYNEAVNLLSRRRGEYLSGNTKIDQSVSVDDIEIYLTSRFDEDEDFQACLSEVRRRLQSNKNPDIIIEQIGSTAKIRSTSEIYSWAGLLHLFWEKYRYLLGLLLFVFFVSSWFIVKMNQELSSRQQAAKHYRTIESYLLAAPNNFMLEDSIQRKLSRDARLTAGDVKGLWPYIRYEAGVRQHVDFIRKYDCGIEKVGWWIDEKAEDNK